MDNSSELIAFSDGIPARLMSVHLIAEERRWRKELEILLVLNGDLQIIDSSHEMFLTDDDLIAINPESLCTLRAPAGCVLLSLSLDLEQLAPRLLSGVFQCNTASDNNKKRYYTLKHYLALLVRENSSPAEHREYKTRALLYSLLHELQKNFWQEENAPAPAEKNRQRLDAILTDIHERYMEGLTLNALAEKHHLSVPYLSAFFEKNMGITFSAYYNDVRLRHAVHDLLATDDSVEQVSSRNGFSDPRSFVNFFKRKYGVLPSLYRKQSRRQANGKNTDIHKQEERENFLHVLAQYLPPKSGDTASMEDIEPDAPYGYTKTLYVESINVSEAVRPLRHTFRKTTAVGRAKELLLAEVQDMLRQWQADMGFEFIKFHGLFSDDMHVYREDDQGKPHYSFVFIDKAFDFLLSIGLKPIVQLSFMPQDLASDPGRIVYSSPYNVSPPKELAKWTDLVRAFMEHIVDRYGLPAVKGWLYCVWNEPDTAQTLFGFPEDESFYRFYRATYQTVKEINRSLIFGSPSMLISCNQNKDWLLGFLNWSRENQCLPDFLNIHYYDNDFTWESLPQHKPAQPSHGRLNRDENSFRRTIAQLHVLKRDLELDIPVYLTEWNLTVSHRNLLNDTCFKSCYLAKNLLENYDELDSFGYWTLTDLIEETQPSPDLFHGGLGLYTYNGIKKPHYYTLKFISRLGDRLVARGNGYFITKSHGSIRIMLYNYEHFNHLFASGETFDMSYTQRYTPFSELGRMDISLELVNMSAKQYTLREYTINQHSGSAFDQWLTMGGLPLREEDMEYLKTASIPKLQTNHIEIENGQFTVSASLEPLEVRHIEISRH